ncbi:Crp/Fnr family transcriptional regulator [Spirosoma montaniterrae]|uniref:Cyclic nucleotide-binding domain-containing protein n=1 Tax=Spirosoma montaniterrae TaxID=1178516 RepID=A0A1P9WY52_9BACT|nr:Crp/Fnr family transcriptional regulator [Spirosoma montaniterrae]AQG80290.1 hypothetical protein AWR27_13760 [Spirosoma montaniterrae]
MRTTINSFTNEKCKLSGDIWATISGAFVTQPAKRGSVLLHEGDVSDKLYFIESGLVRAFYEWEGKEYTSWFASDEQFACSARSFFRQVPSFETIQVIEPSIIAYVRHSDIQRILTAMPEVENLMRLLAEHFLLQNESRLRVLRSLTAQQRFDHFVQHYPELYSRVPLQHLASYLDVTPSTLSRLRAKRSV